MNIKQKEFTKPESPYLITDSWGVERPFELYYKIWNDKVLILFNDMSEIVQREDALKRSEEKYKLLFNKSNDAILLHSLEDNALGRFIEVNEEAQKRYNYSLEEFKMLTPLDITTVKHIKFIPEVIGQLKETGEIVFETVHISSDQRQIQVEVNAHLFYYNFKQYILSIVRDIGQRKEAESELKNYQQYLEKLVKERTDEVNQVNEELMQSNEQLHLANQKLNTKNLALESTYEEMKATNEELYYKNSMLQQTLTELKMTQSKLIQSEKMASIGVLTAGIAHEINNPINFISSSVQGLNTILEQIEAVNQHYAELNADNFRTKIAEIDRFKEEVDYRENLSYLPDIMKSLSTGVDRTVEIIKGLRLFSRIDKEEKRQMDINENMDASITLLKNKYKNKIRIVRRYGKIEPVNCLVGRINQVFMNLLSNAIDAILSKTELSNDETITVKTWQDSQFTYISVADTGPGIKSTIQSRIFEPFFSTKEVGKGTGMGLSISLSIIEQHNGKLELIKSNEKGTEFQISIPNF